MYTHTRTHSHAPQDGGVVREHERRLPPELREVVEHAVGVVVQVLHGVAWRLGLVVGAPRTRAAVAVERPRERVLWGALVHHPLWDAVVQAVLGGQDVL